MIISFSCMIYIYKVITNISLSQFKYRTINGNGINEATKKKKFSSRALSAFGNQEI